MSEDGVGDVQRLVLHQHDVKGVDIRILSLLHLRNKTQTVRTHVLKLKCVDIKNPRMSL